MVGILVVLVVGMTNTMFSVVAEWAKQESENGYVVHVTVKRTPAGDYLFCTSDWLDDKSIAGYENGIELYNHYLHEFGD